MNLLTAIILVVAFIFALGNEMFLLTVATGALIVIASHAICKYINSEREL
ncbi:hypothetical protein VPAG_00031 [Vibrio phage douglas 12A4]|nr:hypothetical protein VPAG_00031 [Vibrio phage douglas 12A4]AGG58067.1 hypothetical protein VPAG_00031 [Vibrio phage douglas 12A4]